ncbi:lactadherin-like [Amphiura filiformis]|uniref:lactadherin-like n=1 Tax=Amphiura filiformis TaxID=82378 RepID=UPI003B21A245
MTQESMFAGSNTNTQRIDREKMADSMNTPLVNVVSGETAEPETVTNAELKAAACQASLGIEDGRIPDNKLTASTVWDDYHGPSNARLNRPAEYPTVGSWSAKYNNISQWIQVDLGVLVGVTGVLIQGRAYNVDARLLGGSDCCPQWVTEFKVQHSNDGIDWHYVLSHNNQDAMIFDGNTDQTTVVTNLFPTLVEARFIRIQPTAWNVHISLRFEVLGCQE